jgi:putative transcriptional regulator
MMPPPHALARGRMTMLRAKHAIELPAVENPLILTDDLAKSSIAVAWTRPALTINLPEQRERTPLTGEQLTIRYNMEVETSRDRETGKREPDTTARGYLRTIVSAPERLEHVCASTPSMQRPVRRPRQLGKPLPAGNTAWREANWAV